MLSVHDSGARWRSFFEETCANEISTLAASWPKQTAFMMEYADIQSWDVPFAELILKHPRATLRNADTVLAAMCRESGYEANPRIRISGLPPDVLHKLRAISSDQVETFTTSEVIVTKVSELKPRIYNAIFTCTTCGNTIEISHPNELELVEPLRYLFKDEVRKIGLGLGLPEEMVFRQPFPGPGLAIRIMGEVTENKLHTLRLSDWVVMDEIKNNNLYNELWQSFAVLLETRTVGVMGDERTYGNVVAIRAVTSEDAMTSDWARIPNDVLAKMSNRIVNEVPNATRVVYDITSKPPGTIEWE